MSTIAPAVHESVLDSVGNTPLLKLSLQHKGRTCGIYAKPEYMNPSGSIKDRIAKYIVEQAESKGLLKPGYTIVEATSGNTGIALAMVAAAKGYRMIVVMPEHMTGERIRMMANLGARVCLTPKADGFEGAVKKAETIASSGGRFFLGNQFRNPDNTMAHYHTTGKEILQQAGGHVDCFVAGIGTGGTLMGVGRALRERNPPTRLVAVEPEEAAILSGRKDILDHKIAGIGDGFVPAIVDLNMIDQVVAIKSDEAVEMSRTLSRQKGLPVGISSGANVLASLNVLEEIGHDKKLVTVLPDRTERYFSTDLYDASGHIVGHCSTHCECPFHRF